LKIAVGMIVLNGDYVLKQCLESIYPYASQIMIAEGPVTFWQQQGITTSTDRTNEILHSFADPENKISIVHGQYSEKDEQCQAYMKFMKPDTDYLIMVDSDETYKAKDIETVIELLRTENYTSIGVKSCSFYGPFQHYITGFEEQKDQFLRIFKVYPGSYWKTHRPPTMVHVQKNILPEKHLDSDTLFEKYGVRMYHYSYVFPKQILNKMKYYQTLASGKFIKNYFEEIYYPWVSGSDTAKLQIETKYSGVHEYKPEFRNSAFTTPFNGEHPEPIKKDMDVLLKEWNDQLQYSTNEKFSLINSWKNKEIFQKQLELNLEELKGMYCFVPFHIGDFLHFAEKIKDVAYRLMDVGCGCGFYSELCKHYAPWIKYEGIDYSQEAIDVAKTQWNGIKFECKNYKELKPEDFKDVDILHACSLTNVLPEGDKCINFLLSLGVNFIILGKILTTSKQSYYDIYKAQDLIDSYMYYHNYSELIESFKKYKYDVIEEIKHDNNSNFLLRKNNV
jgi:SAM-dependent methyltransferase